jgi:hypothetical protein
LCQEHQQLKTTQTVESEELPQIINRIFVIAELLTQQPTPNAGNPNDDLRMDHTFPPPQKSLDLKNGV